METEYYDGYRLHRNSYLMEICNTQSSQFFLMVRIVHYLCCRKAILMNIANFLQAKNRGMKDGQSIHVLCIILLLPHFEEIHLHIILLYINILMLFC